MKNDRFWRSAGRQVGVGGDVYSDGIFLRDDICNFVFRGDTATYIADISKNIQLLCGILRFIPRIFDDGAVLLLRGTSPEQIGCSHTEAD